MVVKFSVCVETASILTQNISTMSLLPEPGPVLPIKKTFCLRAPIG